MLVLWDETYFERLWCQAGLYSWGSRCPQIRAPLLLGTSRSLAHGVDELVAVQEPKTTWPYIYIYIHIFFNHIVMA